MMKDAVTTQLARSLAAVLVVLMPLAAVGAKLPPERPTPAEMTALPEACAARIGGDDASKALWKSRLGTDHFLHLHHLCFGLNYNNRARATLDRKLRQYFLQRAEANFNYVLQRWPADSALRPEAEAGLQETLRMLQLYRR